MSVRFSEVVSLYEQLEATTKRLEMRALLAGALKPLDPLDVPPVVYLSQGLLRPAFEGVELGVGDSLAYRAVALATGTEAAEVERRARGSGDLGDLAAELRVGSTGSERTVADVYGTLLALARTSGPGSQDAKIQLLSDLVKGGAASEAKYLVRFVLGKLRLGVGEMTLLDAFATAWADGTKESRARVEAAFNVSSDLGLVAERLARHGLDGLAEIRLAVGRPVRPMLAERAASLAEILERMEGRAAFEYKYDGLRIQAHVAADGGVRMFSRRLEEIGDQFPDLRDALATAVRRRPSILEGECVSFDVESEEIRPFQEVSRRRGRKYDLERMAAEVPICLFAFDVLLDSGEECLPLSMSERRSRLEGLLAPHDRVRLAVQHPVASVEEGQAVFDEAIGAGCEGIVAKSLKSESAYHPGGRGFWWIKYKREYAQGLADSIDGVVVGAFLGRGRRGGRYGALLMAVHDEERDRYGSFCKVGSGFDDAGLAALPDRLRPFEVDGPPPNVETGLVPDRWFRPGLVLEIRGAELTLSPIHAAAQGAVRPGAGFALRFPRFTGRYRDDKSPEEATTTEELVRLYRTQTQRASGGSADA